MHCNFETIQTAVHIKEPPKVAAHQCLQMQQKLLLLLLLCLQQLETWLESPCHIGGILPHRCAKTLIDGWHVDPVSICTHA